MRRCSCSPPPRPIRSRSAGGAVTHSACSWLSRACALTHAGALDRQQRPQSAADTAGARRREPFRGQHALGRGQRVDAIGLARPALAPARTLDLEDAKALAFEVLAEPGPVAAGTLDPDHDVVAERSRPSDQLAVSDRARFDRELPEQLTELIEGTHDMGVLVGVDPDCDHRFPPHPR